MGSSPPGNFAGALPPDGADGEPGASLFFFPSAEQPPRPKAMQKIRMLKGAMRTASPSLSLCVHHHVVRHLPVSLCCRLGLARFDMRTGALPVSIGARAPTSSAKTARSGSAGPTFLFAGLGGQEYPVYPRQPRFAPPWRRRGPSISLKILSAALGRVTC